MKTKKAQKARNKSVFYIFYALLLPIGLFSLAELALLACHRITGSKLLEPSIEREVREGSIARAPLAGEKQIKKVAIYGGSSAAGFGSENSFQDLILDEGRNNVVIDSYAKAGMPFARHQEKIAIETMSHYDLIVIYAGHNEVFANIFKQAIESGQAWKYPNGKRVTPEEASRFERYSRGFTSQMLSSKSKLATTIKGLRTPEVLGKGLATASDYINRARLRIKRLTRQMSPSSPINKDREVSKYPLYAGKEYIPPSKPEMTKDFEIAVQNIINNLESHQTLVISTVISNDLYPPAVDLKSSVGLETGVDALAKSLYKDVPPRRVDKDSLDQLPPGPHKSYLTALRTCFPKQEKLVEGLLSTTCHSQLRTARGKDMLPTRVLPEINDYIRSLKNKYKNVHVVDPESEISNIMGSKQYLDMFVDYQHPSSNGHAVIARNIAKALGLEAISAPRTDQCNLVRIRENGNWLKEFIRISSVETLHMYYLKKSVAREKSCTHD
ncbi:hypothetical protein [Synechococcus sp. NB0720_010]|uniref:hypothetical protein n=1 Tax=Synechococcus sp. NB0720_010 TaxID=2907159 RepID=UPI001FFC0C01|nr:hypothetical protein [Synechococcus sp. NB0720_010]UPH89190.1 hypothetical protein LY254_07710 [Synechococcus sp. NB0720_010]